MSKESSKQKFPTVDESQLNDDLSSSLGIDYRKLRNFLAVEDFESANKETDSVFVKLLKFEHDYQLYGNIDEWRVKRVSCTDLCTIDRLWVKYSNARFGFSIQANVFNVILTKCYSDAREWAQREKISEDGAEFYNEVTHKSWGAFRRQLGWKNAPIMSNNSEPPGHLPRISFISGDAERNFKYHMDLLERLKECLQS